MATPETGMEITAALVKKLRDPTGAGMMECKAALKEANGDMEEATTILRKRGLAQATKKAGRSTNEGLIGTYIHMGGKIGVLVEVNCESDFVARTEDFQSLARELPCTLPRPARSTCGAKTCRPTCSSASARSTAARWKARTSRPQVIDKIVEGKLNSFYEQVCLLDQPSIRDPKVTIGQAVQAAIAKLGENISIAAVRPLQARRAAQSRLGSRFRADQALEPSAP